MASGKRSRHPPTSRVGMRICSIGIAFEAQYSSRDGCSNQGSRYGRARRSLSSHTRRQRPSGSAEHGRRELHRQHERAPDPERPERVAAAARIEPVVIRVRAREHRRDRLQVRRARGGRPERGDAAVGDPHMPMAPSHHGCTAVQASSSRRSSTSAASIASAAIPLDPPRPRKSTSNVANPRSARNVVACS